MKLTLQSPKQSLNKAYLKQRPLRSQMDLFKSGLIGLLNKIDKKVSEEFHKNWVSVFLKKTIYLELKSIITLFFFLFNFQIAFCSKNDEKAIVQKTNEWNIANSTKNIKKLRDLFPEELVFYGKTFSRDECLIKKGNIFNKYDPFSQVIVSDIVVTDLGNDLYKSTFKKQVAFNEKTKTYLSYLFFKKIDGEFKIVEEGDEITNSNLNYESVYESQTSDKNSNWLIPIMVSVSSIGLISLVVVTYNKRKKREEIILPKPEINTQNQNEQTKDSIQKGMDFERYILDQFEEKYFKMEYWQSDKGHNGRYPESNQNPDFVFRLETQSGWGNLAVECKYQSNINANAPVKFCEDYQLRNYQNFSHRNKMNVFLILGLGGSPKKPEELYFLPILDFKSNIITYKELQRYSKKIGTRFFYNLDFGTLS